MSKCYVYIIECNSPCFKPVKIGIAKNPESRMETLQTGCPFDLRLITKIEMPSRKAAHDLESFLHSKFKNLRMSGEWFKLRYKSINNALSHYNSIMNASAEERSVEHEGIYGSKARTNKEKERIEKELDSMINLDWI
ncbi:coil containing protein [Vibrio phage 1.228.O._10N.261.49.C1]|nr:coil containing protein [Vibrio phage 1.157.O._10N.261.45.B7]AUR96657.1 coil containing protein [Vibrio phage 1.228.O._10N.261.49.C1]